MDAIVIVEDDLQLDFLPNTINDLAALWISYISDQYLYNQAKADIILKIISNFKNISPDTINSMQNLLEENFYYIFNAKVAYLPSFDYQLLSPEQAIQLPDKKRSQYNLEIIKKKIKSILEQ